jgi:hypothetical protein
VKLLYNIAPLAKFEVEIGFETSYISIGYTFLSCRTRQLIQSVARTGAV